MKGTNESYKIVITYFHEIIRIQKMWRQAFTINNDSQTGRRWMDGEETEDRTVKVSPESVPGAMSRRAGQG